MLLDAALPPEEEMAYAIKDNLGIIVIAVVIALIMLVILIKRFSGK